MHNLFNPLVSKAKDPMLYLFQRQITRLLLGVGERQQSAWVIRRCGETNCFLNIFQPMLNLAFHSLYFQKCRRTLEQTKLILDFSHCLTRIHLLQPIFPCHLLLNYLLFIFWNLVVIVSFSCYSFSGTSGGSEYRCMYSICQIYAR